MKLFFALLLYETYIGFSIGIWTDFGSIIIQFERIKAKNIKQPNEIVSSQTFGFKRCIRKTAQNIKKDAAARSIR